MKNYKIYVAGHRGMVGSAIVRLLEKRGYANIFYKSSKELDLRDQHLVYNYISEIKPDIVINAAARVGGILANYSYPYNFIMENLLIQNNLIEGSLKVGVKKFIFLGSSCIYPKLANQPIKEEYLLTGPLEPTNEWYAIAKIAGLKACAAIKRQFGLEYFSLMPTNLYGPNDNFDLHTSHVLPALIRKFHEAKLNSKKEIILWGTGSPLREFLYVDDLAEAVLFSIEHDMNEDWYNVGSGEELSIKRLAQIISEIIYPNVEIKWDISKPDGTPRKLLDSSKLLNMGWYPKTSLRTGIELTYNWYLENLNSIRTVNTF